ncbi:unnamed protein product [Phaedon cochleariae]|uniref:Uncharacterized protein n=1 Tax=Phaedon cochleariae TaxID=80249 RepID=A0A9P0DHS3_PHACE|nr:unnamed protein product [Phaedon cochleariae]
MDKQWFQARSHFLKITLLLFSCTIILATSTTEQEVQDDSILNRELKDYVDKVFSVDQFSIVPGVRIERALNGSAADKGQPRDTARSGDSVEEYFVRKIGRYVDGHVILVNVDETARFLSSSPAADTAAAVSADAGKSSFLTGFGMGFLAMFLKKLLLPVFIGAQLVKSVLIAMFLPSILGGLGKIVGKGLSTFSGISGASTGINHQQNHEEMEDFEFKDVDPYSNDAAIGADINNEADATNQLSVIDTSTMTSANSRFGNSNQRFSLATPQRSDNYYLRRPHKKTDYKVFHKIPDSSLLLTSYDPFYSPLLSRLDAVFQQLGLGNSKSPETERCRERMVCLMYANPAKYAPYSNLLSAQLSRELNELRRPSSDNPDILRFFRYMKAAKDGQDGEECLTHGGCSSLNAQKPSPAMLTTFNDINKLVLARKLN